MKKLLMIAALLSTNLLFASHGGASTTKCTIKYNHCMGDCAVKYGSDTECVARCRDNYENCKASLHTEDYTAPTSATKTEAPKHGESAHH